MRRNRGFIVRAGVCTGTWLVAAGASADTDPGPVATPGPLDEIVVTGVRQSVEVAQTIKRDATSVIESITFEDLGKFADSTMSDALARVPGVNIEKNLLVQQGIGDTATIRGLGPSFGSTTLNGREALGTPGLFGGSGRQFDFGSIPPDILAGVTVYKTSTADLVEPGMAGQIDLRTLRPVDYASHAKKTLFGNVNVTATRSSGADKTGPHFAATFGGVILDGTLGAFVSVLDATDYVRADQFSTYNGQYDIGIADTSGNVTQYHNLWASWGNDSDIADLKYRKTSVAGAIQWKPSANLDVNFDIVSNKSTNTQLSQGMYYQDTGIFNLSSTTIAQPGGATVGANGGGLVQYDTSKISGIGTDQSIGYLAVFSNKNRNEFVETGLNVVWKNSDDRLVVSADLSHGDTQNFLRWVRPYVQNGGGESSFDGRGQTPIIGFQNAPGTELNNPASYTAIAFNDFLEQQLTANRNSGRLDAKFQVNDHLIASAGVRFSQTTTKFISMAYDATTFPTSLKGFFTGGSTHLPFYPVATPTVSYAGFCAANPNFCNQTNDGRGSFNGPFPATAGVPGGSSPFVPATPGDVLDLVPNQTYQVKEKNTAAYTQLAFNGDLLNDWRFTGNAGVRAVRIATTGTAFRGTETRIGFESSPDISSSVDRFTDSNAYWKYLPSVNLTLIPTDRFHIRVGASETMSLAQYQQLAPKGTIILILPLNGVAQPSVANTGNTALKPTSAKNYDLTFEYYTPHGGALIASAFYKDVKDLVTTTTQLNQTIPGQGATLFTVTRAINADRGHTSGFEVGAHEPFTFLPSPFDGLGVQANYTYVDSKTTINGISTTFEGASRNNVNLGAYFENFGFTARVAYLYRSAYLTTLDNGFTFNKGRGQLDASLSYAFTRHFEVLLSGSNLTSTNRYQYSQQGGYATGYFEQPLSMALTFRASL